MKVISLLSLILFSSCLPSMKKGELVFHDGPINTPVVVDPETETFKYTDYQELSEKVLIPYKCIDCHKKMSTEEGLQKYVSGHNHKKSKLYTSVAVTKTMPKGGPNLKDEDMLVVKNYINSIGTEAVSFRTIKEKIIVPYNCLSCHGDMIKEKGTLTYLIPGSPEKSPFYIELLDKRMPEGGKPVSTEELKLVEKYIRGLKQTITLEQ